MVYFYTDEEHSQIVQIDVACHKRKIAFCGAYNKEAEQFKNEDFTISLIGGQYCLRLKKLGIDLCSAEGSTEVVQVRGSQRVPTSDYSFTFIKDSPLPDLADYYATEEELAIEDFYPVVEEAEDTATGKIESS